MPRSAGRWQFSTSDLLLLTFAVGLTVVVVPQIAPHILAGPVHGTLLTSSLVVLLGAILATVSCRIVTSAPSRLEQFIGAFLFAVAGYAAPAIMPFSAPPGYETIYVLICVYLSALAGAILGGFFGRLFALATSQVRQILPPDRPRTRYAILGGLALAAAVVTAIAVMEEDAPWYAPILVMLVGSSIGIASGMLAGTPSSIRWRLLGGTTFSALGFYCATLVLQISELAYGSLLRVMSVYFAGLIGGVLGAFMERTVTRSAQNTGVAPKLKLILSLAPLGLLVGFVAYRVVANSQQASAVAALKRSGVIIMYAEDREPDMESSANVRIPTGVLRFLGLADPTGLGLCSRERSGYVPIDIDPADMDALAVLLPEITHLSIHASHLENSAFVDMVSAAELPKLCSLQIHGQRLDGALLSQLPAMPELELLFLYDTGIKRLTTEGLKKIRSVKGLYLSGTAADDVLVKHLSNLPALEVLSLRDTSISDASAMHLATFSKLQDLDVCRTALTDRSITSLSKMTDLRRLDVRETLLTNSGAGRLRGALASCDIRATLELGVPVASHVYAIASHEWSFSGKGPTLVRFVPILKSSTLRYALVPKMEFESLPKVALPPDWFGLLFGLHPTESIARSIELDPEKERFLLLPMQWSYRCVVGCSSGRSGYEFVLSRVGVTDITERLGETISTELRTSGEPQAFHFPGARGARFRFERVVDGQQADGRVLVINALGVHLFDEPLAKESGEFTLETDGPFFLLIERTDGNAPRPMRFRVTPLSGEGIETPGQSAGVSQGALQDF